MERELVVLRNNNKEDIKLKMIKLEQDYEDCKSEN
jgi:chromosome segregation ATPase